MVCSKGDTKGGAGCESHLRPNSAAVTAAGRDMRAGLLRIWRKQDETIKHMIKENQHA